jgi:hypothetical protein
MSTEVFDLRPVLDNPLFDGFGSGDNPSLLGRDGVFSDFFPADGQNWDWTLAPLAAKWTPIEVRGRVRSFNDFPCLGMMIPAFSLRAADALRDFLEPNGELLPLIHPAGEYYAYNCLKIVEIVDHAASKAMWSHLDPRCALHIDYFAIHAERLAGLSIFRMRELPNICFVTTPFVERVHEHGLNGFHFVKVWPFPEGTNYRLEDKKHWLADRQIVTASGPADIKAESLVICLPLAGAKLSADEKKRIAVIEDEIDAQLFTPTLDTPYFGSLEGKKTAKGMTKLYLSCPNAEALFGKLETWLRSLAWEPRPTAVLRTVGFDDFEAGGREVPV